jgi:DNA-binding response OmpR family regulator
VERRVERGGRRIELTSKEFALLEYLMRNAGRRITRAMIIEHVWNLSFDTCTNVVDVYVNYFDEHSKKRVIQHFYNSLLPHGYLFLGHSESLYGINEDFSLM